MNVLNTNFIKNRKTVKDVHRTYSKKDFVMHNSRNKPSLPEASGTAAFFGTGLQPSSSSSSVYTSSTRDMWSLPWSKEGSKRNDGVMGNDQPSMRSTVDEPKHISGNVTLNVTSQMHTTESNSSWTPTTKNRKTPKTSGSSRYKTSDCGGYVLAVTEGRGQARGEVGIAGMDPRRPLLVLCQISDGQRYINSLTKMNVFDFSEVVVPNTFVDCTPPNKLYCDMRSRFPHVTLTNIQRRHFNESLGLDLIKVYCSPESASVMVLLRDKFYALSAAAALIKYLEFTQNVHLAPGSLKIEYQGTENTVLIDLDTASRLELVTCMKNPDTNRADSLIGVVNHCRTKAGIRLLRANILQPFSSCERIKSRLSCVEELVNDGILFCQLEAAVANFANVESLLNLCMHVPQQGGVRMAEYQLKYTLLLKTSLEQLPQLISALERGKSLYFRQAVQSLKDPRFSAMLEKISKTVFENARVAGRGSVASHLHGCFAIKTGVNGLLDVAKKTYCEIVQDITDHVTELRANHDLPLTISFSASKGFHLRCPFFNGQRKILRKKDLPEEFILVRKSKTAFTFYTAHLVALDKRSHHVLDEIKLMTNAILCDLLTDVRPQVGCLFNMCEIIAELDVIVSFAHVSSIKNYVKPDFGDRLHLKSSRHPILDAIRVGETVPNDVMVEPERNFVVLTGPNQSGKSIYIRQVALLQIMAQVGCFVPATEATFKLVNRIFSRIGFDDSIESNASTMIAEMRDIEYMRQNLTTESMVIVDELCRGTSVEEGTCLAFAICEQMLDSSAFVFFTTHYLFLTRLEEMYSNVVNLHFGCVVKVDESGEETTRFDHRLKAGATQADAYGLRAAERTSFPRDVWTAACAIAAELRRSRKPQARVCGLLERHRLASELKGRLVRHEEGIEWGEVEAAIEGIRNRYLKLSRDSLKKARPSQRQSSARNRGRNGIKARTGCAAARKIRVKYRNLRRRRERNYRGNRKGE